LRAMVDREDEIARVRDVTIEPAALTEPSLSGRAHLGLRLEPPPDTSLHAPDHLAIIDARGDVDVATYELRDRRGRAPQPTRNLVTLGLGRAHHVVMETDVGAPRAQRSLELRDVVRR